LVNLTVAELRVQGDLDVRARLLAG